MTIRPAKKHMHTTCATSNSDQTYWDSRNAMLFSSSET